MAIKEVIDELVVRIETDYSKFTSGLSKVNTELEKASKKALAKLKDFESFGKKMALSITLPLALVGKASLDMSMQVTESENLFEVSMKNMAKAARDFSEKLKKDLGLNAVEVRKNIAVFQAMFNSMEIAEAQAYKMSTTLTELSYDMASLRNIKPEEAFLKIQSGMAGEIEPLRRLGILIDEATVKNVAYANGIAEMGAELTQQQKVLARYAAIMQQTADDQGDLARTLDSPTNKLRIFTEKLKEVAANIGDVLIPAFGKLMDIANSLADAFNSFGEETKKTYVQIGLFVAAIGPAIVGLNKLAAAFAFLMANPVILALTGIAAVIAALSVQASKAKDEQAKLNAELRKTNEIRQKGIDISQIEQIEKEKDEIARLVKEYEKIIEAKEKISNKVSGQESLSTLQIPPGHVEELAEAQQKLNEIEESLDDLGVSYENAKDRVKAYEEALKEANKEKQRQIELQEIRNFISRDELAIDRDLYNTQNESALGLRKLTEEYQELIGKQNLSVTQQENLINITNTLKDLLGEEIVVRNSQNEIIGLNIDAINGEVEAIEANVNAQKEAVRSKIQDEIAFTNTKINEVVKRIEAEKKYIEVLSKLQMPVDEDDPFSFGASMHNSLMNKRINQLRGNLNELDGIVKELQSKKSSYEKELMGIDDINLSTSVNYSANVSGLSKQDKLQDERSRKQQENIREAGDLLREQNSDQLEAIKKEEDALNTSYNNLSDNIKSAKKQWIDAIEEAEKESIKAHNKEKKRIKDLHDEKLDDIEEEKTEKINALQEEIDAINKAANQEDRQEDLDEAKKLLALYEQSSTAEGQKKAKELAKTIRDLENAERIEDLEEQQKDAEDDAEKEAKKATRDYEDEMADLDKLDERIEKHYEKLKEKAEAHFASQEDTLKQLYDAQTKLIDERQYVIEEKNEQMLEAVTAYAHENEDIYLKSAEDIIALLKSKEGDYYQSGVDLAEQFHQGLMDQLEKIKEFETSIGVNLDIPPLPTRKTSQSSESSTRQVSGGTVKLNNNYFGDIVFEMDADIEEFNEDQSKNVSSAIQQSRMN